MNVQLQAHAWVLHKPSESNQAVKFCLSSTAQEETLCLVIYRVSMIQNRLVLSWLKGRGRYKTDLFAAWETSYSTFSFHTGTITIWVCSCLIVKAVARSLSGLLNVWLSNLLPRHVSRDSHLPWRPSPVSSLKMRSSCVPQQGNFPSPGSAWGSVGPSLCSAPGQCFRV